LLFAEQVNVLWLVQVLRAIGGSLEGRSHFSVVTFVFVILGLLDVEPLRRHLRRLGDGTVGATAIDAVAEIAARLQTYMLVRLRQVSSLPPDRSPSGRAGCSSRIGRRVWKYLRIAKHAAAAAKCLRVCPLDKLPAE